MTAFKTTYFDHIVRTDNLSNFTGNYDESKSKNNWPQCYTVKMHASTNIG